MAHYFFNRFTSENLIYWGLLLFYVIFFFNLTIDSGSNWKLLQIIILLFPLVLYKNKRIVMNINIFITIFSAFIFIYLNELFFHSSQQLTNLDNDLFIDRWNLQFLYVLVLILLPTIFYRSKFNSDIFFKIIIISTIISLIYNLFISIILSFDRSLLVGKFPILILYDYSIISLTLLAFCYSFKFKKTISYILISLCLANITIITLHGSRGAWLGIPIILLFIFIFNYKSEKNKVIFSLALSSIIALLLIYLPQSPITQRMDQFKADTTLMEKQNYHSSVGNRVALWKFSLESFAESPIYGVGTKKLTQDICTLKNKGVIPVCNPHLHNIFLQELASHGILGFLAVILTLFTPLIYFIRTLMNTYDRELRVLAISGICFTGYIIICGLTDYILFQNFITMLLYLVLITLMSFIYHRKNLIQNSPSKSTNQPNSVTL